MPTPEPFFVVADIGGTHARFALGGDRGLNEVRTLRSAEYPSFEPMLLDFLEEVGAPAAPADLARLEAAIAVAGPTHQDRITLTNLGGSFSCSSLALRLGRLVVLNDFEALALALPDLEIGDVHLLLGEAAAPCAAAPRGVLGPGTGLGMAGLICIEGRRIALPGEGGHRDLAAVSDREWQVVRRLRSVHGRVSCERVLSGPGLTSLYRTLCELDGREPEVLSPAAVLARAGDTEEAAEAVEIFCALLGSVAGDFALTLGARGGIYLGGGLIGHMGSAFRSDAFAERFLDKGRLRSYMEGIPVFRIDHPHPGLTGAAWALRHADRRLAA